MRSLVSPRPAVSRPRPDWGPRTLDALMFAVVMIGAVALVAFLGAESARWAG